MNPSRKNAVEALSRRTRETLVSTESSPEIVRVQALAAAILEDVVRENGSDVHLTPIQTGYQIRLRIDGNLVDTVRLDRETGLHLLRSFKGHADLDTAYALRPQDGRAEFRVGDQNVALRVASMPSVLGETLALRLLPSRMAALRLDQLGLRTHHHAELARALQDAGGMTLVSGPTGSGKTTTIYALIHELRGTGRAILTLEDPVEYIIDDVTQVQVSDKQGLTFAEGVKGLLRLDPDIIFMGEMRDPVSARSALDAASSGHVFLSTLHARDVAGTISALRHFGLADHEIAASLDLVISQRLVRRLCPACRQCGPPTMDERNWLTFYGQPVPERSWQPVGCPACAHSGYRGRLGIFEVWRLREADSDLILQHADERTLRRHIHGDGRGSLLEDELAKAADGLTSLEEVFWVGGMGFYAQHPTPLTSAPATR